MRTTLPLAAAVTIAAAVAALPSHSARADDPKPPPGFTALFDGKDLTGWEGHTTMAERVKFPPEALAELKKKRTEAAKEHWSVKDGAIFLDGKPSTNWTVDPSGKVVMGKGTAGLNLATAKDYGNFEFYVDWKIEKGGDSGIYLRGQPQVQIWDSDNLKGDSLKPDLGTGSGGLWNNPLPKGVDPKTIGKTPLKKADKSVGEWNTFRIIMKGDKVTVYLNGELVVDNQPLAPYKPFNDKLPEKGPIELQFHNDPIWFRNIYVKELP